MIHALSNDDTSTPRQRERAKDASVKNGLENHANLKSRAAEKT